MGEMKDSAKIMRELKYETPEPSVIFRIAWYSIASKPGVRLIEYSEAESQDFVATAMFTAEVESHPIRIRFSVEGVAANVKITAFGDDEEILAKYIDEAKDELESSIKKYLALSDDAKSRVRRALVAKTCWDRVVYHILSKSVVGVIYFQVAHGREMMIKATEGEDIHPITLTTSGWLSKIESLEPEEIMPGGIATELAKKSIEWKKDTHEVIARLFSGS